MVRNWDCYKTCGSILAALSIVAGGGCAEESDANSETKTRGVDASIPNEGEQEPAASTLEPGSESDSAVESPTGSTSGPLSTGQSAAPTVSSTAPAQTTEDPTVPEQQGSGGPAGTGAVSGDPSSSEVEAGGPESNPSGSGTMVALPAEPTPGPGEPLTPEEFCTRRAHLDDDWCAYRDKCCTAEDQASSVFGLPGCWDQPLVEAACVEEMETALADGLTFDGTWAEECLAALGELGFKPPSTCSGLLIDESYVSNHTAPPLWSLTPCEHMLTANVGNGQPCNNVRACAPGLGCGPSTNTENDEFLCHTPGGIGAPCYSENECENGLTCYPVIENGYCQLPSPSGGPCEAVDNCEDGTMCHLDYCAPVLALGESCPNSTFCLSELSCDFGTAKCVAVLADGEGPCSSNYDCEGRCDMTTSTCTSICGGQR